MAIFHYELEVIPKEFFEKHRFNLSKGLDENFAWEGFNPPDEKFVEKVKELLPFNHSWPGGDVEEYQSKEDWSSKIQIYKEDDKLESIILKFSPIKDKLELLFAFVLLAKDEGYLLYSKSSQSLVNVDIKAITENLEQSNAFKFIQNSEKAIVEAAKELNDKDY